MICDALCDTLHMSVCVLLTIWLVDTAQQPPSQLPPPSSSPPLSGGGGGSYGYMVSGTSDSMHYDGYYAMQAGHECHSQAVYRRQSPDEATTSGPWLFRPDGVSYWMISSNTAVGVCATQCHPLCNLAKTRRSCTRRSCEASNLASRSGWR